MRWQHSGATEWMTAAYSGQQKNTWLNLRAHNGWHSTCEALSVLVKGASASFVLVALGAPQGPFTGPSGQRQLQQPHIQPAASADIHRSTSQDSLLHTTEKSCEMLQLWTYVTAAWHSTSPSVRFTAHHYHCLGSWGLCRWIEDISHKFPCGLTCYVNTHVSLHTSCGLVNVFSEN